MKLFRSQALFVGAAAAAVALVPRLAWAQDDTLNSGDTAWMLTSSVLVLFMTIPGLSLFYAGLVRAKNVLSVMMQCFAITCMVTILWTGLRIRSGVRGRRRAQRVRRHGEVLPVGCWRRHGAGHDPRDRLPDVPADVCHHHASAHRRCLR